MMKIKFVVVLLLLCVLIYLIDFGLCGCVLMGFWFIKCVFGVLGVDVSFRGASKVDVSVRSVGLFVVDILGLY